LRKEIAACGPEVPVFSLETLSFRVLPEDKKVEIPLFYPEKPSFRVETEK
jgi:hypothetical protein